MALGNPPGYNLAREVSEPDFVCKLKTCNRFINIKQGSETDDVNHIDVFAEFKIKSNHIIELWFDVKDKEFQNINTPNYSITEVEVNNIKQNPEKYKYHYFACVEYINGKKTGKYLLIRSLKALNFENECLKYVDTYYLLNIPNCEKRKLVIVF